MDDAFKIYVEQLRDGHTETINEVFSSGFIGVQEKDLKFVRDAAVSGQAYLANDTLVLHLDVAAFGVIPCSICNEPVEVKVEIKNFYHTEPLGDIKSGIYNFKELLREEILLATPGFAECEGGKCPRRKEIKRYMKKHPQGRNISDEEGYQPFADLNLDKLKPKN